MNHREVAVPDVVGGSLVLHYVIAPLGDRPPYSGTVMTAVNVTVETRAAKSASRALLVAEMTEQMNAGVDPDAALQALADRLVPEVADLAAVYITAATPPEGGSRRAAWPSPSLSTRFSPRPPVLLRHRHPGRAP